MDFCYREEEEAVAELARTILEDHATNERLKEFEAGDACWDEALWRSLAQANLLGVAVPEEYGGSDLGFLALCRLLQEVGRTVAPVPVYPSLVLGALPIAQFGGDEQKRAWLPGLVSGEHVVTGALAERDASDPLAPATRAEATAEGVRLTGVKTQVPAAEQALRILVPARFEDGAIGLFFIAPKAEGVTLTAQCGSDGQPLAQLTLDGVCVGEDDRLGEAGQGAEALRWIVDRAVAARCMMQLGVSERSLAMTAEYSRERVQFERPIGSFQAVHQRAADAYIQVESIRLSAQEAAWRLSEGLDAQEQVAVAKYWAAEGGNQAAYACQHLHGGIGIDTDYPLHRYFEWSIQIEHELGSARHQLDKLGREIAEKGVPAR